MSFFRYDVNDKYIVVGGNKEMYDLKVRNLSKTAEARLKELAGKHHMGVEPYVRQLLEEFVLQPERILLLF